MQRADQRQANETRAISFTRQFTAHAAGSVLTSFGNTKVICTASVEQGTPRFLQDKKKGWITAEYSMLPSATHDRSKREATRGKQTGRTIEIQRLIGRSLRAAVDLDALGEHTITLDCDVIQADGGTRTAAISGACVALVDAINVMRTNKWIHTNPLKHLIAAISVGICHGQAVADLDYPEDSQCETDMNIVMTEHGQFIEVQGTAEGETFNQEQLQEMLALAKQGIEKIVKIQKSCWE